MAKDPVAREAALSLRRVAPDLGRLHCLVGFDGFIDTLYRVVKEHTPGQPARFYRTIPEFALRVERSAGKSSDTEIARQEVRPGGNGPILADALARLGAAVTCVGGLGQDGLEEPFRPLAQRLRCISVGPAGHTMAFEFDDGKLMFGDDGGLAGLTWEDITHRVGRGALHDMIRECSLIAVVDWAYLHNMASIVEGLCTDILAPMTAADLRGKTFLFDMADFSARSPEEVRIMCRAMERTAVLTDVILGLNQNEAQMLGRILGAPDPGRDLAEDARAIAARLGVRTVVVHGHHHAVAIRDGELARTEGFYVERPRLTIGGGDVFNAGLCLGLSTGAPLAHALILGRAASSHLVATGQAPTAAELIGLLERES